MGLFRSSSLGPFQFSSPAVESISKTPAAWGSANWHESAKAARTSWNATRSSVVCFSLWSHDRWRSVRKAVWTNVISLSSSVSSVTLDQCQWRPARSRKVNQCQTVDHCLLGYTLSKHHVLLKCLLQKNITWHNLSLQWNQKFSLQLHNHSLFGEGVQLTLDPSGSKSLHPWMWEWNSSWAPIIILLWDVKRRQDLWHGDAFSSAVSRGS